MFPKNKINIIFRVLCLICFIMAIIVVNSVKLLIILFIFFSFLALCEKSFRNIELIAITIILLGISYLIGNYWLFKIMLLIDYCFYFLDTSYFDIEDDEDDLDENDYIRFKKKNKKKEGLNNTIAIYLTVHLVVLFIAILVG